MVVIKNNLRIRFLDFLDDTDSILVMRMAEREMSAVEGMK